MCTLSPSWPWCAEQRRGALRQPTVRCLMFMSLRGLVDHTLSVVGVWGVGAPDPPRPHLVRSRALSCWTWLKRASSEGATAGRCPQHTARGIACEDGLLHTRRQMARARRRHDEPSVGNPFLMRKTHGHHRRVCICAFHSLFALRDSSDPARLRRRTTQRLTPARLHSTATRLAVAFCVAPGDFGLQRRGERGA